MFIKALNVNWPGWPNIFLKRTSLLMVGYKSIQRDMEWSLPLLCNSSSNTYDEKKYKVKVKIENKTMCMSTKHFCSVSITVIKHRWDDAPDTNCKLNSKLIHYLPEILPCFSSVVVWLDSSLSVSPLLLPVLEFACAPQMISTCLLFHNLPTKLKQSHQHNYLIWKTFTDIANSPLSKFLPHK